MEPKHRAPNASPELQPSPTQHEQQAVVGAEHEIAPQLAQPEKESARHERVGEAQPRAVTTQQDQTVLANPPQVVADDVSVQTANDATTPAVAADDDNIEKEWVDKAKSIINETKSDPHLQEKRVSRLQADYLEKRYNKKIKLRDD